MATKEGDAGLYSDDFADPAWDKDTSPWTSLNIDQTASCVQVGETISLGWTGSERRRIWDGVYEGPTIYQTFTDDDWSVEVKCTGSLPLSDTNEWGLMAWEADDAAGPVCALFTTGSSELRLWMGDNMQGQDPSDVNVNITAEGVTTSPYYIKFQRVAATDTYSVYYKQDEEDSWSQAGSSYVYAGSPTQLRLYVASFYASEPHTQTFDYVHETAAGAPAAPGTRRILIIS